MPCNAVQDVASSLGVSPSDPRVRDALRARVAAADDGSRYGPAGAEPPGGKGFAAGALAARFDQARCPSTSSTTTTTRTLLPHPTSTLPSDHAWRPPEYRLF